MEPSTILIGLLCLALLVYLPKLRNTVFWILFPFVMVFVRYPKTRKPGLGLGCLGLAVGGVLYGISSYRERHYWYCDIWRNKDHSQTFGRNGGDDGMQCERGLKACETAHVDPVHNSIYDYFNDWADYDGYTCSHRFPTIWSYESTITLAATDKDPAMPLAVIEQFGTKQECESARANVKDATGCYQDEKATTAAVSGPAHAAGARPLTDLEMDEAAGAKPLPQTDLERAIAAGGKPVDQASGGGLTYEQLVAMGAKPVPVAVAKPVVASRPIVPDPGSVKPPAELQRRDDPFAAYLKPDPKSVKPPAELQPDPRLRAMARRVARIARSLATKAAPNVAPL